MRFNAFRNREKEEEEKNTSKYRRFYHKVHYKVELKTGMEIVSQLTNRTNDQPIRFFSFFFNVALKSAQIFSTASTYHFNFALH